MKIIIFGVGKYYEKRKKDIEECNDIDIIAYTDNNSALWGKQIDGVPVIPPDYIEKFSYDKIVIMTLYAQEIFNQLQACGIEESRIRFGPQFSAELIYRGKRKIFQGNTSQGKYKKRILIISEALNYTGAPIAAFYAAMAFQHRGYAIMLAAPNVDREFVQEVVERGITVALCPELPYLYDTKWLGEFDVVMVNTLPMLQSAYACCMLRPTFWWLHEATSFYESEKSKPWNKIEKDKLQRIHIFGVSNLAKKNFNTLFLNQMQKILCYGIPDVYDSSKIEMAGREKIVFAIIGSVCERKAQDIFVEAAVQVKNKIPVEFWIIGSLDDDIYGEKIYEICDDQQSIKLMGQLTRKEIYDVFPQIDVVVCASREDPLPIVMTEGMMFGKVCITTDATGTVDYIQDGVNGFVVPQGDIEALKEKMEWVINNRERIDKIGNCARSTYEQYFTMDIFEENLERAVFETEKKWKTDNNIVEE